MTRLRCIELFAGAGGAALGLERAGLHHAALCEWDRDACATLRAAGLGPVVEGDVRDLDAIAAAAGPDPVDVLWSSFPCQAFSTAGKRLGAADERNGWPWTVDAINHFHPTWVLGENVRGLLLHRAGCTYRGGQEGLFAAADPMICPGCYFERVILADLRARFAHVGWWLLDAADYGVPQHRRRVILWAGPRPLVEPTPTHGPGRALPWVSMGRALGLTSGEVYTQRSPDTARGGNRWIPVDEPATTIICAAQPQWRPAYTGRWEDGRGEVRADGPAPTVTTEWGHSAPWTKAGAGWVVQSGVCHSDCRTRGIARECTEPAPTVPVSSHLYLEQPSHTGRRRLTVAECAVLQDFPADHPWQGGVGARYRQAGNAVPPRLAEVVGRALVEAAK